MTTDIDRESKKKRLISSLVKELPVLRARLGLSQAEFAEKAGISRQTYNGIETGNKTMNWLTFTSLIAVFYSNESTRLMLDSVEGLEDDLRDVLGVDKSPAQPRDSKHDHSGGE